MSAYNETYLRNRSILVPVVYVSAATACLLGQIQDVRAAVFEQTCSGKVITMGSAAPGGVPLLPSLDAQPTLVSSVIQSAPPFAAGASNVPVGAAMAADATAASQTICADASAGTANLNSSALRVIRQLDGCADMPRAARKSSFAVEAAMVRA